jgi:hypothetical protein
VIVGWRGPASSNWILAKINTGCPVDLVDSTSTLLWSRNSKSVFLVLFLANWNPRFDNGVMELLRYSYGVLIIQDVAVE